MCHSNGNMFTLQSETQAVRGRILGGTGRRGAVEEPLGEAAVTGAIPAERHVSRSVSSAVPEDRWLDDANGERGGVARALGVLPGVEARRGEILGPVKRQLAVPAQILGNGGQPLDMRLDLAWQLPVLRLEHRGHVVDARRRDAVRAQQPFQRELHHFLRFADDVRPARGVEEHVQRADPHGRPAHVVGRQLRVSQAASLVVQYG